MNPYFFLSVCLSVESVIDRWNCWFITLTDEYSCHLLRLTDEESIDGERLVGHSTRS